MGKKDNDRGVNVGLYREKKLTELLRKLGMHIEQSNDLDYVFKIDALITGDKMIKGHFEPIGLQITKSTKRTIKKKRTFLKEAAKGTTGPLLYAEIVGRVTPNMGAGLRAAMICLWLDKGMRKRAHGIQINSAGRFRWFDIREQIKLAEEHGKRKRGQ